MTKREKLIQKAIRNPKGLKFSELLTLARALGYEIREGKGSHTKLVKPGLARPVIVQPLKGMAKGYQVEQLLEGEGLK